MLSLAASAVSSSTSSLIYFASFRGPTPPRACLSSSGRDPQSNSHGGNKLVSKPSPSSSSSSSNSSISAPFLLSSEDGDYLVKLTLGSVAGAALVKYGSLLLPGITRQPNVFLAFLVVALPVGIALGILILATLQGQRENNHIS